MSLVADEPLGTLHSGGSYCLKNSPWTQRHKDEELRAEILQDVERCMLEFTRTPETQRMLVDILWVFCKLNPDGTKPSQSVKRWQLLTTCL